MLQLQFEKPSSGDWANKCLSDIQNINLKLTLDEIRETSKQKYLRMLKEKNISKCIETFVGKARQKRKRNFIYLC